MLGCDASQFKLGYSLTIFTMADVLLGCSWGVILNLYQKSLASDLSGILFNLHPETDYAEWD